MSKFGDLMGGAPSVAPVVPPVVEEPVVEAPGTPASVEPPYVAPDTTLGSAPVVITEDLPDVPATPVPTHSDLKNKSKYELEQIGRTIGVELDRRHSHSQLVNELLEAFAN